MVSKPAGSAEFSESDLKLLDLITGSHSPSQRQLASEAGVSLGMVNLILKRLARTGYIKVRNLDQRKMHYLLTAKGLAEKSRRSYDYLQRTLRVYGAYRARIGELIRTEIQAGHRRFALLGEGELLDLASMALKEYDGKVNCRIVKWPESVKEGERLLLCTLHGNTSPDGISVLEALLHSEATQ